MIQKSESCVIAMQFLTLFVLRYKDFFSLHYWWDNKEKNHENLQHNDIKNVARIKSEKQKKNFNKKNHEWKMRILFIIHFRASYSSFYPLNNWCASCCRSLLFIRFLLELLLVVNVCLALVSIAFFFIHSFTIFCTLSLLVVYSHFFHSTTVRCQVE